MGRVRIVGERSGRVWPLVLRAARESGEAGRRLILYVPEQMTLQAERDLICDLRLPGLLNIQVISPRKLRQQVRVQVLSVDLDRRRIGLRLLNPCKDGK